MAAAGPGSRCSACGSPSAPSSCPRCNLRLCSLRCFRAHGGCAEAFYRREVLGELRNRRDQGANRGRLAQALRRLPEPREDVGENRGLWERLSAAERAGFLRLVRSGEAERLLPPWRPWWWRRRPRGEEAEPGEAAERAAERAGERFAARTPPPGAPLPPLAAFPAPPPSPLLRFQVPNALYGYAFALCLHRGDPELFSAAAAAAVAASASLRSSPRHFRSVAEALSVARHDVTAAGYPQSPLGDVGTALAVAELLEGRGEGEGGDDVTRALSHLESVLLEGRGLGRARMKCRYLRAWARENPGACREMGREAREVCDVMRGRRDVTGEGEGGGGMEELD